MVRNRAGGRRRPGVGKDEEEAEAEEEEDLRLDYESAIFLSR